MFGMTQSIDLYRFIMISYLLMETLSMLFSDTNKLSDNKILTLVAYSLHPLSCLEYLFLIIFYHLVHEFRFNNGHL
jgi:hypothetical protein